MENVFCHPHALLESTKIGDGTRVWAFAHILPGATIGRDCSICDHVFIENEVSLGDRVTVKSGVQLWDGVHVEDDVFIGPNATFCNDRFPRSNDSPEKHQKVTIRKGASIGAAATILSEITVGRHAMVGAGAVVTTDVPAHAVVVGNPARVVRLLGTTPMDVADHPNLSKVKLITDHRGELLVREVGSTLPFTPQRVFVILSVPGQHVRGDHAHKELQQYLVALSGSVSVVLDDGERRESVRLDSPGLGLYVPPMTWCTLYNYSPDTVVMALASCPYDAEDYVRDYEEFCRLKGVL